MNCTMCNRPMVLINATSNLYYCYLCAYQAFLQANVMNPGGPIVSVQVMNGEP
jgi:hypothetical protein